MQDHPQVGSTVTCAETGKPFIVQRDGSTFNYATSSKGEILSDEGVDAREKRELLDRSKPFVCYVSGDGQHITGWKGNVLGDVTTHSTAANGWWGSTIHHYSVRDVHGAYWHGRGAGRGMVIRLRPSKHAPR